MVADPMICRRCRKPIEPCDGDSCEQWRVVDVDGLSGHSCEAAPVGGGHKPAGDDS